MKDEDLGKGSSRWALRPDDGTAQDPIHPGEPVEYFQDGSGPSTVTFLVLAAIAILVGLAYLALSYHNPGGAR